MIHIALVLQTPRDPHSAVFITTERLAAELRSRGHEVTILTPQDIPAMARWSGRWTPLVYPVLVAQWLRRRIGQIDLVVFHSYAGWFAAVTGAARSFRTVVWSHGFEPLWHAELRLELGGLSWRYRVLQEWLMPRFLRVACRRADLVMCLNSEEHEYARRHGWTSPARIVQYAHGVPAGFFAPPPVRRPAAQVLFVGQWQPIKGIWYLSRAMTQLMRSHAHLRLVCAGTLTSPDSVLPAFPDDVRSRVTVLPRVERSALMDLFRASDIFVLPSLAEGFGLAILEAMASRLPIVTTAVGVAADALQDSVSALIVPKRDTGAIVAAVERLLADDDLRVRLGNGAYRVALEYPEADRIREQADLLLGALTTAESAVSRTGADGRPSAGAPPGGPIR